MTALPLAAAFIVLAAFPGGSACAQSTSERPEGAGAVTEPGPETTALLRLANLYWTGRGIPVDAERAIGYFRQAARTGEPAALMALGNALVTLQPGQANGNEIAEAFERAAAAGTVEALPLLGDFHSDGKVVPVNLERAYRYYVAAAEAGDVRAKLRVAEMLATGQGTTADPDSGMALLHALADEGSGSAMLSLGDIYSSGSAGVVDGAQAVRFLELAAAHGRPEALVRLGQLYLEGTVVPRRPKAAAAMFEQAAGAGYAPAQYALGAGYLSGELSGSEAAGREVLGAAVEGGNDDAVVLLAGALLRGIGIDGDVDAALAALVQARDAGNVSAGTHLVGIFRDGVTKDGATLVARNLETAQSHLEAVARKLDRGALLHETLLLAAAKSTGSAFLSTASQFGELSPSDQASALGGLLRVNPNAYVLLLQSRMAEIGYFAGRRSGILDRGTIAALNRFCADRGLRQICRIGPLRPQVARALVVAFRPARQASGS